MYSRLPPNPQRKEPELDIFPEPQEGVSKPGLSNYLDEFLSAIKVFGYLERPVFHELTRTMQTRKLIAGETLHLEEEHGFCVVMDGVVQIFVKSYRENCYIDIDGRPSGDASPDEEDDRNRQGNQGYQLLNEVRNGAPMSSLFSILSLFTEDISLRHEQDNDHGHVLSPSTPLTPISPVRNDPDFSAREIKGINPVETRDFQRKSPRQNRASTVSDVSGNLPNIPHLSLDPTLKSFKPERGSRGQEDSNLKQSKSAHPDIVARATVDTTIAIIPATAFRRLTRIYPKATAHIVQVIITRLQRVTLATGHAYLGLTSEVLMTEKLMNKFTTYDLPGFLRGSALERLKEKFLKAGTPRLEGYDYAF
jgi:lysophospholipid hydrolase